MRSRCSTVRMILFFTWVGAAWCFAQTNDSRGVSAHTPRRVACVGDSITYGSGVTDRASDAYPAQLQTLLGDEYEVRNFGRRGARVTQRSSNPYLVSDEFKAAFAYEPDSVVICLGVNDCSVGEWEANKAHFVADYRGLIQAFRALPSKPKISLTTLLPVMPPYEPYLGIQRNLSECQSLIARVAQLEGLPLIDVFTRLNMEPNYFRDGLHPRKEGARLLAELVQHGLTGDHGGLALPWVFSDHMVLQRDKPIPVFGIANTGATVTVQLNEHVAHGVADVNGRWRVDLPSMSAGGPYTLRIDDGATTLKYADVLIGEVWIAAGQSNMQWPLNKDTDWETESKRAGSCPKLRLLNRSYHPITNKEQWSAAELANVTVDDYFDGQWEVCSPSAAGPFSAVAYYFGREIQTATDLPVGVIHVAVGGASMEAFMPRATLAESELYLLTRDWLNAECAPPWRRGRAKLNLGHWFEGPQDTPLPHHPYEPCFLYHSTVQEIMPFAIRGVIWYQGETNATDDRDDTPWDVEQNRELFSKLITSWRKNWGQGDFPFYYVQLPNSSRNWMAFREMQRQMLTELPNLGMAVAIDCGDPSNVHPRNKYPIGKRLSLWARAQVYGENELVYSGPLFNGEINKGDATLSMGFDHVGTGLRSSDGGEITGFEVAGPEGDWRPAKATVNGHDVVLTNEHIANPQAVRYAWAPNPKMNLVNSADLPAAPLQAGELSFDTHPAVTKTDSFEDYARGMIAAPLDGVLGQWRVTQGNAEINGHARTGQQAVRIAGGQTQQLELQFREPVRNAKLAFAAERWSKHGAFEFTLELHTGEQWQTVFQDAGQRIITGEYGPPIEFTLAQPIDALRFTCTSGENTGVLIDDVSLIPLQPMRITHVTMQQPILPVLVGNRINPIARLRIDTEGVLDPIALTGVDLTLASSQDLKDLEQVTLYAGDEYFSYRLPNDIFDEAMRLGEPRLAQRSLHLAGRLPLRPGTNYFWISVQLSEQVDPDGWVDASCEAVQLSNGTTIIPEMTAPPQRQRYGIALRQAGDDGVKAYRIPGIVTTHQGTLIAVYDARYDGWPDLPANIDVAMSRSTDGGRTWEPMKVIMDMGNDPQWRYDGNGDPCILVDRMTNTIWVAALWSHGERGWNGSGPGLEPEETGQFTLVRSDDDGRTWSAPLNITQQIKDPAWSLLLAGPGEGICTADGTLVFPAQYRDALANDQIPHATIVYSKDHGQTWRIGTGAKPETTESRVVELEPGTLMLNMRDNRGGSRAVRLTRDWGATWEKHPSTRSALPEPICNAGLTKVRATDDPSRPWLAFVNPAVADKPRRRMTLKLSTDGGLTWPAQHQLLLDEGRSAGYASLTMIDAETLGVLYESSRGNITFQRIRLETLLGLTERQPVDQTSRLTTD